MRARFQNLVNLFQTKNQGFRFTILSVIRLLYKEDLDTENTEKTQRTQSNQVRKVKTL